MSSNPGPNPTSGGGMDKARDVAASAARGTQAAFGRLVAAVAHLDRHWLAWGSIALAALVLLAVNVLATTSLQNWRADVTEDSLFSITPSTRKVLASLDEPISVKVYYSQALGQNAPAYQSYFERVRALLDRYRALSGGKIQLSFITPEPFSDAEDRAVAAGLKGIRLNTEGDQAYFGLVASNSTDNVESVPFFNTDRDKFLEYDLTKIVYNLSKPKKKIVGLISGLPLEGGQNAMVQQKLPPWAILGQIKEFYEVRTLEAGLKEIPADIDTLMLVEPKLTPDAAFAIDQFALKGGRVLAFVDPVPEVGRIFNMGQDVPVPDELKTLLGAWGVTWDPTKVAADYTHARRVQYGGGGRPAVTEYVTWLGLDRRNLDDTEPMAAGIETLNIASAGVLEKADGAKTKIEPLIQTSARASIVEASKIGPRPDPVALLKDYKPGTQRLVLAARVTGEAVTAFPDGAPKPAAADAKPEDGKAADGAAPDAPKPDAKSDAATKGPESIKTGRVNVVVFADTDFLHDQFWLDERDFLGQRVQIPLASNATMVINAIETLAGGEALSDLRGRGVKPRPFTLVDDIRRDAERRYREKEQALVAKLKETEQKLAGLEQKGEGGQVILTDKDRETVDKFRAELLGIRRELRDTKLAMRQDIDRLEGTLKFANIAVVPLLIVLGVAGFAFWRRRTRGPATSG